MLYILLRDIMSEIRRKFFEILRLEKERNLALEEISELIGFDISFSSELIIKNATDTFLKLRTKEKIQELMVMF